MELRRLFAILLCLVLGNKYISGQVQESPILYNAHRGITFEQDKELRLDSSTISSNIYNDSIRMDIVYYINNISCSHPIRLLMPDFGWFIEYSPNQINLKKESLWDIYFNNKKESNNNLHFTNEYNQYWIESERDNLSAELSWLIFNERVDSVIMLYGGKIVSNENIVNSDKVVYPSKEKEQAAKKAISQLEQERKKYLESKGQRNNIDYSNMYALWKQFEIGKSYEIRISYCTSPSYNREMGMQKWFQYRFDGMENFLCDNSIVKVNINVPDSKIISIENLQPSDCRIDYEKGEIRYQIKGDNISKIKDIKFLYRLVSDNISKERSPYPQVISFD